MTSSSNEIDRYWWLERWYVVMESVGMKDHLELNESNIHLERVLSLDVNASSVTSEVQGSRYEPYEVKIVIQPFSEDEWKEAVKALASQALFSAKLLSGQVPENIESAFAGVGLSLFPNSSDELTMYCSCADEGLPCSHILATNFALAEKLEEDPFLLFRWRGLSREKILRQLRHLRAAEAAGRDVDDSEHQSLEELIPNYWKLGDSFSTVTISVRPPEVASSLLRSFGVPSFWEPHPEIRGSLDRLYEKVTERAMALAYGGRGIGDSDL